MLKRDAPLLTVIIAAMVALGPLSTDMYLPAMPAMAKSLGGGIDDIQLTLSVFLVGFAVSQLFYGALSDRYGRKPVLIGSFFVFTVATFGCATADSVAELVAWRFVQSVGACAGPVLGRAMVRDIHGREGAARVLSNIATVMALAPAVAPVIGGYLVVAFGWPSVFVFLGLFGIAACAVVVTLVPESLERTDPGAIRPLTMLGNFLVLLRHRDYMGYVLCCSAVFAGVFAFLSGASFVLIDHLGVAEQHFGLYFTLVVAGYMTGTVIGGRLSARYRPAQLLRFGALASALAGVVLWLAAAGGQETVAAVIGPMMLYMVGVGIVMPQSMAGALAPFPRMAGAASALFGFIQMSLAAVVGVLVGLFHDGTAYAMATAIALTGLATLACHAALVARPPKPD